ncbi:zinc-binding dehydrogenase [Kitasatospora acidiphila]|uniref:Zinc-binding dehydrogenase n=1 Tax=Kitasatospora acidiphila TaxID=2567942 RepID=A0A540VYF0_9ACTN|nr:zinc-binding dehydrogenase [Kitasatospora acidiphila]TQF01783.1 zinc-binding dehydrogenase [Kitasatospora acidiphila]
MKAIGFTENGAPQVLRPVELPVPEPGPGQVLIKVAYAGVNYGEVQHRLGDFGAPDGVDVTGLEASGHIAALGPGVEPGEGFAIGDPVAAYLPTGGGYAEYAVAPAELVFPLHTAAGEIDLRTAGGAGLVLPTAYGLLAEAARLRPGDTVLIHAAAGGVGSAAAQLARALGAKAVYGTVGSTAKAEYATRFGYDELFGREGFTEAVLKATGGRGVDVVLDPVGGPTRLASLEALAPFGRVTIFGEAARHPDLELPLLSLWKNNRTLAGYNIADLSRRDPQLARSHGLAAFDLLATGQVTIDITGVLPLSAAVEAHERMQAGAVQGKLLLQVADEA